MLNTQVLYILYILQHRMKTVWQMRQFLFIKKFIKAFKNEDKVSEELWEFRISG